MGKQIGVDIIDFMALDMEFDPDVIAAFFRSKAESIDDPEVISAIGADQVAKIKDIFIYDEHRQVGAHIVINKQQREVALCTEVAVQALKIAARKSKSGEIVIRPLDGKTMRVDIPHGNVRIHPVTMVKARKSLNTVFFICERADCYIILEVHSDCSYNLYIKTK